MTRVGLLKVNEACLSSAAPVDTMMEPECACAKHLCSIIDLMYNLLTALIQTLYLDKHISFYAIMIASNCLKMHSVPLYVCIQYGSHFSISTFAISDFGLILSVYLYIDQQIFTLFTSA